MMTDSFSNRSPMPSPLQGPCACGVLARLLLYQTFLNIAILKKSENFLNVYGACFWTNVKLILVRP